MLQTNQPSRRRDLGGDKREMNVSELNDDNNATFAGNHFYYGRPMYYNRAGHYIFVLWFLPSSSFISSPNLSGCRLDVYHTSTHGVALVRISNAGLVRSFKRTIKLVDFSQFLKCF